MPRYLALFTPATPMSAPPDPAHMAKMGKYMEESMKSGKLVATGALKKREVDGFVVRAEGGKFSVDATNNPDWMGANGWAILQADSREAVIEDVKEFLGLVGDGRSEVIELFQPPGM